MRILAVDTSAIASSAAILEDDVILAESNLNVKLTHSQTIMPMVQNMLDSSMIKLDSIDAFAVSAGPGSFTGVRIGISAIKGMAMALNKPCAAVSSLEALAWNLAGQPALACPVMDARRNQVYNSLFAMEKGIPSRLCEDRAISLDDLYDKLRHYEQKIILVGDGANLCAKAYEEKKHTNIIIAPSILRYQKAASVGLLALKKLEQEDAISPEKLMPVYLRLPQAQRERLAKLNQKDDES